MISAHGVQDIRADHDSFSRANASRIPQRGLLETGKLLQNNHISENARSAVVSPSGWVGGIPNGGFCATTPNSGYFDPNTMVMRKRCLT